ncbi:MAG: hypothetical protein RL711_870 [Bacteroidota bacterium]|jgi:lysyl-tRNA synthetase class I
MKKHIVVFVIGLFIFQACEHAEKNRTAIKTNKTNILLIKTTKDSASVAWKRMMLNDDIKFKNMLSLLDHISYIPGSKENDIKQLKIEIEKTWKTRYDSSQMKAQIVDNFDLKTSELIGKINAIAEKTKGIEKYANVTTLQQEISEADNTKLMLDRAHYDKWAKTYNALITKDHKESLGVQLPLFETLN